MNKHTPGPWQIVNGADVFTPLGAVNAAGIEAAHNDGWQIADCCGFYTSTADGEVQLDYAEAHANARLIAAAPDLLDALIELCEAGDEAWGEGRSCVRIARAAIAKATGETP